MKILGTDFVVYAVSDIERSIQFYRDVLGLQLDNFWQDVPWAEFKVPPTTLALFDPSKFDPGSSPKPGGAAIALAVEDVPAAAAELKEKGVNVIVAPFETPVCWNAYVLDPDGNMVGLHQRKDGSFG